MTTSGDSTGSASGRHYTEARPSQSENDEEQALLSTVHSDVDRDSASTGQSALGDLAANDKCQFKDAEDAAAAEDAWETSGTSEKLLAAGLEYRRSAPVHLAPPDNVNIAGPTTKAVDCSSTALSGMLSADTHGTNHVSHPRVCMCGASGAGGECIRPLHAGWWRWHSL